ncbi:MAG: MutH/Sau3AI family endonuclease [Thermoplasmatota archaeon]
MAGVPLPEIARAHGIRWNPKGPASNKSYAGDVVEAALGKGKDSSPHRDLQYAEVKTIPIKPDLSVREHTKLTHFTFDEVFNQHWYESRAYQKSRVVLFAPVVKAVLGRPDDWYIHSPFLWMPTEEDDELLRRDYELAQSILKSGDMTRLSSAKPPNGEFQILIPNTGGTGKKDLTHFRSSGTEMRPKRRAWMLRKDFTGPIVRANIAYSPGQD